MLSAGGCSSSGTGPGLNPGATTGGMLNGTGADGGPLPTTGGSVPGSSSTGGTNGNTNTAGTTANGTTGTTGMEKCGAITREAPQARGGVDVVFLLDTSGSMFHATEQVINNLSAFITQFENSIADTRVVMITGSDPAAGTPVANMPDRYRFIQSEVDSKMLYTEALAHVPDYQDFLRPNAAVQFVMITDDNDLIPPDTFRTEMEGLLGKPFTQHAIASENLGGLPCVSQSTFSMALCAPGLDLIPAVCRAAAIGEIYYSLADATGGVTASVCEGDWTGVFEKLEAAVIAAVPLPCDYPLAEVETTDTIDPDKVQIHYQSDMIPREEFPRANTPEACADNRGWFYDNPDNPSTISLCPAACEAVQQGGSIDLAFGCEPVVIDII